MASLAKTKKSVLVIAFTTMALKTLKCGSRRYYNCRNISVVQTDETDMIIMPTEKREGRVLGIQDKFTLSSVPNQPL